MEEKEPVVITETVSQEFVETKKFNFVPVIIGVLLVALVGVGAYFFLVKSPDQVFETTIMKLFDKIEDNVDKYVPEQNLNEKDFGIKGNLSFDTTHDLGDYEDLKNYSIDFNTEFSLVKELMKIEFGVNKESGNFLNANLFAQDGKIYASIPELLSRTLEIDDFDWEENFTMIETSYSKADLRTVLVETKSMILKTLDKSKVKETKNESAFGKSNLNKINYTLDEELQKETLTKMVDFIKNNEVYLEALSKFVNEDMDVIVEEFEDMVDAYEYSTDIVIDLYTEGMLNNIVGATIKIGNGSINVDATTMVIENTEVKMTFEKKDNTYTLVVDSEDLDGSITVDVKELSSTKFNADIKFDVNFENENYKLNLSIEIDQDINVTKEDVSDATLIENLTVEETQELYINLFKIIEDTPFESLLNSAMSGLV